MTDLREYFKLVEQGIKRDSVPNCGDESKSWR